MVDALPDLVCQRGFYRRYGGKQRSGLDADRSRVRRDGRHRGDWSSLARASGKRHNGRDRDCDDEAAQDPGEKINVLNFGHEDKRDIEG